VFFILGTRPEIIKFSPVISAFQNQLDVSIVHTGQHFSYEMDRIFFEELELPIPAFHLDTGSGSHGEQTGRMLAGLDDLFSRENPALVVVLGDTNTTLAGALAAAKLGIPVAHIEAGCRSFNRAMPEEINRVVADHLSDLLFAPDGQAVKNLTKEGFPSGRIFQVGSTGVEACRLHAQLAGKRWPVDWGLQERQYLLATIHRAETVDRPERLRSILEALAELPPTMPLLLPLHPRTALRAKEEGLSFPPNIRILPPQGYLEFLTLLDRSLMVLTDSGGVQEEAATLGIPYLVLREETEWQEYIERGQGKIVGWEKDRIVQEAKNLLEHPSLLAGMRHVDTASLERPSAEILKVIQAFLAGLPVQ